MGRGGHAGLLTDQGALGREQIVHWTTPGRLIFLPQDLGDWFSV